MRRPGKTICILFTAVILALQGLMLSSCGPNIQPDSYMVYYLNASGDDIIYKRWTIDGSSEMTCQERTDKLLKLLFETDLEEEQLFPAKPKEVGIIDFNDTENLITFDFDSHYLEMNNVQEILLRAALVLTMIQQSNITQVRFTVEGNPLTDSYGKPIGTMDASNFVDILLNEEGMLKQETDLTLFFTDETGTKLIPAKYHFTISNTNLNMEEYILQQLKAGPEIDATYPIMDPDVEIISVMTTDRVCYVNFGSNFLEQEQQASDEILIYSIVNSLCCLSYVDSVQFLVNGSSDVKLHTVTDLSSPFRRNWDLEQ